NLEGNVLEIAIKCCQRQIQANKLASINNSSSSHVQPQTTSTISAPTPQMPVNSTSPHTLQNRKPHRNLMSTGRPRGRPPNANKYLQHAMQQSSNVMNQFGSKSNFTNFMSASEPNRSMINPYFMNSLVDANMLSAILTSGLSGNMMDPISAMSYLNQVGSYQDILRQYQNNLSSLTNLASGLSNPDVPSSSVKYHGYKKPSAGNKPAKPTPAMDVPSSSLSSSTSFPQGSTVEALSMLSQLQQHSHLEIIPQQKSPQLKPSLDYSKSLSSLSVVPQKVISEKSATPSTTADCLTVYDMPRAKPANVSNKKTQDKLINESVEIITLDD
ncbi:hypothetical protein EAG_00889, partial [Camponotus floridanus]